MTSQKYTLIYAVHQKLSCSVVMMEGRRVYNERFLYPDPLLAASKSTRHRALKKRRLEVDQHSPPAADLAPVCEDVDSADIDTSQAQSVVEDEEGTDECVSGDGDCVDSDFCPEDACVEEDNELFSHSNDSRSTVDLSSQSVFLNCLLTVTESVLLIKKYQMRHNLTQEALSDLLQLMRLHFPSPNHFPRTVYLFNKETPVLCDPLEYTYFCSRCLQEIPSKDEATCPNIACGRSLVSERGAVSSFIEIPLEPQILTILQRDGVFPIIEGYPRRKRDGCVSDISDGSLYQELVASDFLRNPLNISFQLNTDGVPVFRSSSFSFWPIHILINELPPRMRVKKENRLLAGLWYGSSKPEMSLFLRPLAETLTKLYKHGVGVTIHGRDKFTCRVALVCCTCDLPAKALVLNAVQYNGFYGCSCCLQKGKTVTTHRNGRVHSFPYIAEDSTGPSRTDKETREHAKKAHLEGTPVYGVKGPSILSLVPKFDLVRGIAVDYMHCALLGVTRLLLRLWFGSSYHSESWYIGRQVTEVDMRLCAIRPPNEIPRTPRSIEKTLKYWKAHELQAWLIHYSPAVLCGILPQEYYQHHLLLVEGVFLLLKDEVKDEDIRQSSRLFKHYCILFATYYGDRYITATVHSLLHLPASVRCLGPLWSHSCFPFEAANGDLLKMFHGSQSIEKQIAGHLSELQKMPTSAQSLLPEDSPQMDFYMRMCHSDKVVKNAVSVTENVRLCGKPTTVTLTDSETDLLTSVGVHLTGPILSFPQLQFASSGRIVTTDAKQTLRDNSCVLYAKEGSSRVGILHKIFRSRETFAFVKILVPSGDPLCEDDVTYARINDHFKKVSFPRRHTMDVVNVDQFQDKCLLMNINQSSIFISVFPNNKQIT